jgi:hypothetical protein
VQEQGPDTGAKLEHDTAGEGRAECRFGHLLTHYDDGSS